MSHGATYVPPAAGGGGGGGTVYIDDFIFTKSVDASSPRLFRALTLGVHMPTLTITMTDQLGGQFTYALTDVLVSSLSEQVVYRCDGYAIRGERVTVTFRKVEYKDLTTGNSWNYDTQTHTGTGT